MTPTPPQVGQDGQQTRVSQRQGVGLAVETPEPERQPGYSARWLDFYAAHQEEYDSAWLNPGQASRAILERLAHEFFYLRHSKPACMCKCNHAACRDWRVNTGGHGTVRVGQLDDVAREIGRTSPVHPPMPAAEMLDVRRIPRNLRSRGQQVAFLNGSLAA